MEKKFMTRKEVAEYLQISLQTLWKYGRRGLLTPQKIGGGRNGPVRFLASEVAALFQARTA